MALIEVNGQQYQHATVVPIATITGATFPFKTHKKISYKVKAPKNASNDAQGKVDGFTIQKQENEGTLTLKLSEWLRFRVFLLAQNPSMGVLQCAFDLPVTYGNKINAVKTDTIRGCMAQEDPRESEDNQDVLVVEIPLFFMTCDFHDGPAVAYGP